jgi:hypothetical protein
MLDTVNKVIFDFHFDIFIFENKEDKNAIKQAICPVPGCC